MRVVVTGTPGTGKTTATEHVETELTAIHLNEVIREQGLTTGHDDERDSAIADLDTVKAWLEGREDVLVESHLAHHVEADRVIVLRCHPENLAERLTDRGEPPATASENAQSEALDVILAEAVERHSRERVYEIDTTARSPASVAVDIEAVITGNREPSAGTVDFTEFL